MISSQNKDGAGTGDGLLQTMAKTDRDMYFASSLIMCQGLGHYSKELLVRKMGGGVWW